jgi:hypothetical protein
MPTTYLLDEDHIARYIRSGLLIRDETRTIIGVHPPAFFLRETERNLSVDWMECYPGGKSAQLIEVVRHAELQLKKNDAYGVLQVGIFSDVCAKKNVKVRIIYEPTPNNPAHSEVHQYPRDNLELATALAILASDDVTRVGDI